MAVGTDGDHATAPAVTLLWGGRPAPTRGPKRSLSVEQLADVAVADTEGIDAVSMQRVAEDLGVTKMSLYRYVAAKSELVAVMIEPAVGDPPNLSRVRGVWGVPEIRPRLVTWAFAPSLGRF
jgi:AcrR family transcriptional regulator